MKQRRLPPRHCRPQIEPLEPRLALAVVGVSTRETDSATANATSANTNWSWTGPDTFISGNGNFVAFTSSANNLVPGDYGETPNVFVRNRLTGEIKLADSSFTGVLGTNSFNPVVSDDGRYVAFASSTNFFHDRYQHGYPAIYFKDLQTGELSIVSAGEQWMDWTAASSAARITRDGRYVVFKSYQKNLVPGQTTAYAGDFVRDMSTGQISYASSLPDVYRNISSGMISSDGKYEIFQSDASNLVPNDLNGVTDVFVKDLITGEIHALSAPPAGAITQQAGNDASDKPAVSADGRYVVFQSYADNLVPGDTNESQDVFLRDMDTGTLTLISTNSDGVPGDYHSSYPSISADGRFVAFASLASNLAVGDVWGSWPDVFVKDVLTGAVTRVSTALDGGFANAYVSEPVISADGRYVAFTSPASNLVAGDTNGRADIFVRDLQTGITKRVSATTTGAQITGDASDASISADGRRIAYTVYASNFRQNVFLTDTQTGLVSQLNTGISSLANYDAQQPTISADGTLVAFFWKDFTYIKNLQTQTLTRPFQGTTWLGYRLPGGTSIQYAPYRYASTFSADGRYLAYASDAYTTEGMHEIFLMDLQSGLIRRMTNPAGIRANARSTYPVISGNGQYIVYASDADNLAVGDFNKTSDVFRGEVNFAATSNPITASIPQNLQATAGGLLTIPVWVQNFGNTGSMLQSFEAAVFLDADVFEVQSVVLGDLTYRNPGWQVTSQIDATNGMVLISASSLQPLEGAFRYELLNVKVKVKDTAAAGTRRIDLAEATKMGAATRANGGSVPILPALSSSDRDSSDGLVTILAGPASPVQPLPTATYHLGQIRVTGTAGDDLIIVAPLSGGLARVRVNNRLLGDFAHTVQVVVDGAGGNDSIYIHPSLVNGAGPSAPEAVAERRSTAAQPSKPPPIRQRDRTTPVSQQSAAIDLALLQLLLSHELKLRDE